MQTVHMVVAIAIVTSSTSGLIIIDSPGAAICKKGKIVFQMLWLPSLLRHKPL